MSDLIKRHQDVIAPVIAFDTDVVAEWAQGIWVHTPMAGNMPTSPAGRP